MKIDIWSDMVCPFCYIGKRRLEKALEQSGDKEKAEIIFHAFELNPQSPRELGVDIHQALAEKYGMTLEQARAANENVGKMAKEEGLDFHFDSMRYTNTFDAHRLIVLAKKEDREKELMELLMKAYFTEGMLISDPQTLTEIGTKAGLNPREIKDLLESDQYSAEVRQDEAEARQRQISGVPYFVINDKIVVSGAQPSSVFTQALDKASP